MEEDDPQFFCHPTWHWTLLVQPAAHHRRSIPGQETNGRGSKCPTQLLYEIFLLYLGLISHWHQHCQLGCNSGLFPTKGSIETQVPPRLLRANPLRASMTVFGAAQSFYVCTSRLQGFELFCTVCEDFCTLPSNVVPRFSVCFRMPCFHRTLFFQTAGSLGKTLKRLKF